MALPVLKEIMMKDVVLRQHIPSEICNKKTSCISYEIMNNSEAY